MMEAKTNSFKEYLDDTATWESVKPKIELEYAYKVLTICETCIHFEVCARILQKEAETTGVCSDYSGFCMNCKFNNNGKCIMNSMRIKDTDFCNYWEEK